MELARTSLRTPARAMLSPISVSRRICVSAEMVMVPGKATCSSDLPIQTVGRKVTGRSFGRRARTAATLPSAMTVSTATARCGPCCSTAAMGRTAIHAAVSPARNSSVVISAQSCFGAMGASPQPALAATTSTSTLNSGLVKPETIISVEAGGGLVTCRSREAM